MVYNNNKKMSGRYMTASESDKVTADSETNKGIVGTVEPELNHDKDEDYDVSEDVDVGFLFDDTSNIEVPKLLIDQVLGQEHAVEVVKKGSQPEKAHHDDRDAGNR